MLSVLGRSHIADSIFVTQESCKNLVVLKEDDPGAVEEILRKIYGCTLPEADQRSWRFWLNLVTAADKYLEVSLSDKANTFFVYSAWKEKNPDAIFDIIEAIKSEASLLEKLMQLAEQLRYHNLQALLDNDRYRATLDNDKALMWEQLDELKVRSWPAPAKCTPGDGLVKKRHFLCPVHHSAFYTRSSTSTDKKTEGPCTICHPDKPKTGHEQILWVST